MKSGLRSFFLYGIFVFSSTQAMDDRDVSIEFFRPITDVTQHEINRVHQYNYGSYSFAEKLQGITSLARAPLAISAHFLKTKNRKLGYLMSALTNMVRLCDNSLSILNNGLNRYSTFLTGYDLVRCGADIATAFNNEQPNLETELSSATISLATVRKIVLPLIEAGAAFYGVCHDGTSDDLLRIKAQSISTFAQLLSDYFDSPFNSLESKLLLACLIINGLSGIYDFTWAKSPANEEDLVRIQDAIDEVQQENERLTAELQRRNEPQHQRQRIVNAHLIHTDQNNYVRIEHIEHHTYRDNNSSSMGSSRLVNHSNVTCPDCTRAYNVNDQLTVLPCDHTYHTNCLNNRVEQPHACGLCNEPLGEERLDVVVLN